MKRFLGILLLVIMSMGFTGCFGIIKPYKEPKFVEAKSYESLIIIPKVGNAGDQSKLKSEEALRNGLIATRRHELRQDWVKTGRLPASGHWEVMEEVIKISRKPVVKEWTNGTYNGTSKANQALEGQTKDDIGFTQGWSVIANVPESLVVKYAFNYSDRDLESVIDDEIRTMIETNYSYKMKAYTLDELKQTVSKTDLRTHEQEIVQEVIEETKAFFKNQGINITNLGYKGQRAYINQEIQNAIDGVYAKAKLQEASKIQREIDEKNAAVSRTIAEDDAQNKRTIAEADAKSAREILRLDAEAQAKAYRDISKEISPNILKLKEIEMYEKVWDGDLTETIVNGAGGNTPLIMNLNKN